MARSSTRIAKLTRAKTLEGETLHFVTKAFRGGRDTIDVIDKGNVPAFDGDEAWFELEQVKATPWNYWRAIRRVDPPAW